MPKTPEEKAADLKFGKAVEEYMRAYDGKDLVIDWMLVVAEHSVDAEGSMTAMSMYVSPEQSIYRTAGLATYATQRVNKAW